MIMAGQGIDCTLRVVLINLSGTQAARINHHFYKQINIMQKMNNVVQNYAWGSKDALTRLYGIKNPQGKPMAELWMGAHPKGSSSIADTSGRQRTLLDLINENKEAYLGTAVARDFGELPFLFKVLCAARPLSIQVHPNKAAAMAGFARENAAGIPVNTERRNYQDANHKPELVFALTPFMAMNGFRELNETAALLQPVHSAHKDIEAFLQQPDAPHLMTLFASLLNLSGKQKEHALTVLKSTLSHQQGEAFAAVRKIATFYPDDTGLFAPLLLNVITLQPGQAMFLQAETPHAYLEGVALEVMANSDNVLRAGLTEKHIDIPELLANIQCIPQSTSALLLQTKKQDGMELFPVPVPDFAFSLHELSAAPQNLVQSSAAIVFCISGVAILEKQGQQLSLMPGESCFIAAFEAPVKVSGEGHIARVYNLTSS